MKLYRHYKNKHYRVTGHARHSETLDEYTIYEALYDNQLGRMWIRPRKMFEQDVQVDGRVRPRFAKVEMRIERIEVLGREHFEAAAELNHAIFGGSRADGLARMQSKLEGVTNPYLLLASVEHQSVGFKLGFEHTNECYYSWLGGVIPEFRGLGIGRELILAQHQWCREKGYKVVRTKTLNQWRDMLLLNIRSGFAIVGCEPDEGRGVKIVLEKNLD